MSLIFLVLNDFKKALGKELSCTLRYGSSDTPSRNQRWMALKWSLGSLLLHGKGWYGNRKDIAFT